MVCDSLHSLLKLLLIEKIVVLKRGQVAVKFEDQGASSGDIVANDVSIGHLSEMLNNRAKRVAVSDNDDTLPVKNLGANLVIPVGKHTVDGDF